MPTITFNVHDIAGVSLPADAQPEAILTPSWPTATDAGEVITSAPRHYTPTATGLVTATVISADDVPDPAWHMRLQIRWLNPDGYGSGAGYSVIDFPDFEIRVPVGGGRLTDFIKPPTGGQLWWIDIVPPPHDGYRWWVDLSTEPPTLKENV